MSNPVTSLTAAALITEDAIIARPLLHIEAGRIASIGSLAVDAAPPGMLDLRDALLSAGLFDIHVHGAGGFDLMDSDPAAITTVGRMLAQHGTTSYLATTVTASVDLTLAALDRMAAAIEAEPATGCAQPIGIHLEGPFLSHRKRGVHPEADLQPPSLQLFERFWQAARGHVRLMTIAPELAGATELIAFAAERGVRCSLGHSDATAAEALQGIAAGAVSATHTYNAMRALDHREPGILGITLDREDLYADLICDGVHVLPELVRLWWRSKGPQRSILISDGLAPTGMPPGHYRLGEMDVEVRNGACMHGDTIAGSVLTLDRAIQNFRRFTGADLATAVRLASRNPAQMLGADRALQPGSPADLCVFNPAGQRTATILRGELLNG